MSVREPIYYARGAVMPQWSWCAGAPLVKLNRYGTICCNICDQWLRGDQWYVRQPAFPGMWRRVCMRCAKQETEPERAPVGDAAQQEPAGK